MKKIKYTKPTIKCVKIAEDLLGANSPFNVNETESMPSFKSGGGDVLSKPHSFFDEAPSEGSSSSIWSE